MSSAEHFKTALASGDQQLTVNVGKKVADLATAKNAVFAINGDSCGQSHTTGYVIRNGVQYRSSARDSSGETESLILYGDGTMTIIDERTTPLSSVTNAWQVFSFGPGLIKNNSIAVTTNQEISGDKSMNDNPRTAIGMVEPLHYVMIVGNGRTRESKGLTLYQLAQALAYEGCTLGYNLDGGGSSTLWFQGKVINYPTTNGGYKEREVSDIVYIGA
jgi:exopolysaccharide biosynthesis protein